MSLLIWILSFVRPEVGHMKIIRDHIESYLFVLPPLKFFIKMINQDEHTKAK